MTWRSHIFFISIVIRMRNAKKPPQAFFQKTGAYTLMGRKHPAVFLDRDGTLVHPAHYPSRQEDLQLYDGIGPELRALQQAGFRLVVITNQAGIARGYFTEVDLQAMHDYLRRELERRGVFLDGIYHCPHHPDGVIPELSIRCECRKPQPGMILQAATDLDLDLRRSWLVGDILDDVEAGNRADCRTILVDLGTEQPPRVRERFPTYIARNTIHALRIIGAIEMRGLETDLGYCPETWQTAGNTACSRGIYDA
jgi:D-glycero-D-manno-heptose 1,7-bisphosphate phosphatase